jgi:hypothetical protein
MLASKATPGFPSRYEWVQEAYEQLTLCKYNGRPHTGKNWDRTFTNPRCPVVAKLGDNFNKMVAMQVRVYRLKYEMPGSWGSKGLLWEKFLYLKLSSATRRQGKVQTLRMYARCDVFAARVMAAMLLRVLHTGTAQSLDRAKPWITHAFGYSPACTSFFTHLMHHMHIIIIIKLPS